MNWKLIRHIDLWIGIPLVSITLMFRIMMDRFERSSPVQGISSILLVKFWGIGNLCMMVPAVTALRERYPGAETDLLTLKPNRDATEEMRCFSAVYSIDTSSAFRLFRSTLAAIRLLRKRRYDIVIDFEQFARFSALLCFMIGGKMTVGFRTSGQHRHGLYTTPIAYDNSMHTIRSYCSLVRAAGAEPEACAAPFLKERSPDRCNALEIRTKIGVDPDSPLIVLHVGTSENFKERRWPVEHYATLADILIENNGAFVVLTGLAEERAIAAEVLGCMRSRDRVVDTSGDLNFHEFLSLIRTSDLVVSADTAAVHLASAAGIPVIGLYGPNTPVLYGPWGANSLSFYKQFDCSPCITNFNSKLHVCRHPAGKGACMKAIAPEEVYAAIRERFRAPVATSGRGSR